MEQNQGMPEQPVNPIVDALEQTEPVQPTPAPVQAAPAPKKKSSTMVLVIILLLLVAAGGVGFGVWAMMDGNSRVETAKKNCAASSSAATTCDVPDDDDTDTTTSFKNPVVSSTIGDYTVSLGGSTNIDSGKTMYINIANGEITGCHYSIGGDCTISGVNGKIYKTAQIGEGQDIVGFYQGFLMEDGTVQYFGLADANEKTSYSIEGTLNIGGKVTDIIENVGANNVGAEFGGFGTTLFVLSDGSIVKFDTSMLQQ